MAPAPERSPVRPQQRAAASLDLAARNVRAATTRAPARPAYAAGLRAALATVVPLLAAQLTGTSGGTWMSLAGFSGALADKGGAYDARAWAIAAVTVFGAITTFVGAVASHQPVVAVSLTFAIAVACSLGRAWGNTGASVGGSVLNMFVISLAYPAAGLASAFGRSGWVVVGGMWTALLALVLWPIRPYRPARAAVAACFSTLETYVRQLADALASPAKPDDQLPGGSVAVRASLEHARATLATIRRGRPGESSRGDRLLVMSETADRIFGNLLALVDTVAAVPPSARDAARHAILAATLGDIAAVLHELSARVEEERQTGAARVSFSGAPLRTLTPADRTGASSDLLATGEMGWVDAQYDHAAALIDRIAMFTGVAAANVAALDGDRSIAPAFPPEAEEVREPRAVLAPLRSVLSRDSLVLRHALRVGLVTAAAVALADVFDLPRGYWVTITVVIILQPYTSSTTIKAVQRVIGTVVGGILTAALGAFFHDPRGILVLSFVFAATSVALLPINYAAFSVFLTPTFVLLAEASAGDWHLAGVRVLNTLLGGLLALVGARLLWPAPEWRRLPAYLAAALRANREYLQTVVRHFDDRSDEASRLMRARRRDAALAAINAEESFQRLIGEHSGPTETLAPAMTFLTYVRRLTVSIAALAVSRHAVDPGTADALARFAAAASARLEGAAMRVEGTSSAEEPPADAMADPRPHDPLVRARLTRLSRQVETLTGVAEELGMLVGFADRR